MHDTLEEFRRYREKMNEMILSSGNPLHADALRNNHHHLHDLPDLPDHIHLNYGFQRLQRLRGWTSVANSEDRTCWPMRTSAGHVPNDSLNKSALAKSRRPPVPSGSWRRWVMRSFSLPASLWMKTKALTVGRSVSVGGRVWEVMGMMVRVSMMPPAFLTLSTTSSTIFCLGSSSVSSDSRVMRRSNLPVIRWISRTSGIALKRPRISCSRPGFVLTRRKLLNSYTEF